MKCEQQARRDPVRILVVEDDLAARHIILRLLQQLGHRADSARDGAEAIGMLESRSYDLVLMDVMMPVMDGLEATRVIRSDASMVRDHEIPIVAVTALAQTPGRRKCLDAGMNGFLPKPVRGRTLGEVIESLVARDGGPGGGERELS